MLGRIQKGVVFILARAWFFLAGSEPAIRPASYFDMDIEDAKLHPWLEYSVWQDQEWVRIYTPGQPQRWHHGDTVPDLPDNSFREWQRLTDPSGRTGEHGQAWTIRDWQHQGYQRILSRSESFTTHHAHDQFRITDAGTRCCVQHLLHPISVASLARLGNQAPCPLPPKTTQGGDRVFCHSAHTRPSMRGEESPFLQEDHMLHFVFLSLTKISTAARGRRNSPKPLRRREREITTMSIASVAIED